MTRASSRPARAPTPQDAPPELELYEDDGYYDDDGYEDGGYYDEGRYDDGHDEYEDDGHYDDEDRYDEDGYDEDDGYYDEDDGYEEEWDSFSGEIALEVRSEMKRAGMRGRRAKRLFENIRDRVREGRLRKRWQERRARRQRPSAPPPTTAPSRPSSRSPRSSRSSRPPRQQPRRLLSARQAGAWGPVVKLNDNIVAQVRGGRRMAVLQLRPGLYIVADVAEQAILPTLEGGLGMTGGALATAITAVAQRTLSEQGRERRAARRERRQERREDGGMLSNLLNRYREPALDTDAPAPLSLAGCCEWCDR